jgi:AcrR family transcriptional regulator
MRPAPARRPLATPRPVPAARRGARVRMDREQRVGDILVAARAVFTERGYDAAAMSDIAARCGIVEGTVYKYFDSKRALLLKVLENWYEELFGDYRRELPGLAGTRPKLRFLVWRHLRTVHDNPLLARLMFLEVRSQHDYLGSDLHAMNRRYSAMLVDVIRAGIAAGEVRAGTVPATVRDLVYGGLEHLTWRYVAGHGRLDVDRQADELVALLWGGLEARPDARPDTAGAAPLAEQLARLSRIADRLDRATATAAAAAEATSAEATSATTPSARTRRAPR